MKYTKNALNVLTACSYPHAKEAWIVQNIKMNQSDEQIVLLLNQLLVKHKKSTTTLEEFTRLRESYKTEILAKLENCCDGMTAWGDDDFPQHNKKINDGKQSVMLFYKGDLSLLKPENGKISVIGLLNPEGNIEERERKIVRKIVETGNTIVSGLALGCDSIAHQQTLDSKGKTIAILPSPLYDILPTKNQNMAKNIVENGGLLITEYYDDIKNAFDLRARYVKRDRLQALFCDTIILVASYDKTSAERWPHLYGKKLDSGARLAMEDAKNFGVPRAVMYDQQEDQTNPMFDLNRDLIATDKNITILTQENYADKIQEFKQNKPILKPTVQQSLNF